jgi:phosphoribosylanthranilate isomerase
VLLDAWHDRQYGGTGQTLDWTRLQQGIAAIGTMPWVLAGGLRADNVGEAIRQLRPSSVDTASGVESSPGVKDAAEIQRFVHAARAAFDAL